jgi:predicted glycoside hydrolase/deacetylase ChbG (UPF0249 family)
MKPIVPLAAALLLGMGAAPTPPPPTAAPPAPPTTAERLGYPRDARLLLVHADDLGMAHSIDAATIEALAGGLVSSASIMVPCPWFAEIAAWAKSHPDADLGLHLTLTSEWPSYRWGPLLSRERAPSLFAPDGFFYPSEDLAAPHLDAREAEAEIRAQIDRAVASGIRPTHLDSHMGTLYKRKELLEALLRVGRDYGLPIRIAREWLADPAYAFVPPEQALIDHTISATPEVAPGRWKQFYDDEIRRARPGVTLVTIHLARDDEEMRAMTADHPDWGAAWRQRDLDYFTSPALRRLLAENHIELITYRQLARLLPAAAAAR